MFYAPQLESDKSLILEQTEFLSNSNYRRQHQISCLVSCVEGKIVSQGDNHAGSLCMEPVSRAPNLGHPSCDVGRTDENPADFLDAPMKYEYRHSSSHSGSSFPGNIRSTAQSLPKYCGTQDDGVRKYT